jgi:hypothetical protein
MTQVVRVGPGAGVVCPKCGIPGTLKVETFRAAGKEYRYWTVLHGRRRCILKRYEEGETELALPQPPEAQPPAREAAEAEEEGEYTAAEAVEAISSVKPPEREAYPRRVQRPAWYIVKLAASWGSLRENPTEENYRRLLNAAAQVTERLGVPTADLAVAAEQFLKTKSETAKIKVNEALTTVVCRIVTQVLAERGETPLAGGAPAEPSGLEEAAARLEEGLSKLESRVQAIAETVAALEARSRETAEEVAKRLEEERGKLALAAQTVAALAAALEREREKIAEEVAKRAAEAVAQALAQRRAGGAGRAGVKALVLQILSDGKPRTRREIERELRERFGVEAREKPLSGRLSELKRAGLVAMEVREGVFYWRIAEGGGGR